MNLKIALIVLVATVIAIVALSSRGGINKPQRGYYELSKDEQSALHSAYSREIWRLKGQLEWRLEQARLYRRWEAAKVYEERLNYVAGMTAVLNDLRADPTVYHEDLQKLDNWLKTGN